VKKKKERERTKNSPEAMRINDGIGEKRAASRRKRGGVGP